ncbi:pyruvate, phosphate dikinase [Tindallia californiensis]|uniref:Pyruvate, phosphate dikinase n=1 Tax=Tindallia californiensis TaxID=159292 RepID=A0A1H3JT43_9FIRM|nr:pyruvate, phosphate dikinase [Tindallia californiensis]SDY42779.1 pyruvate phosphate dikinase [Tindallia californiensis]
MKKYVYAFHEGSTDLKPLLGGKGSNLAEMTRIGLPVPGGYTVTTEACIEYYEKGNIIWDELRHQIEEKQLELEKMMEKTLGDIKNPLLVSVRSGAAVSMPGMMDTILNLGLNDETAKGMAEITKNPRFVFDSYRRLIQMFSDVVLEIPKYKFDNLLETKKREKEVKSDTDLTEEDLRELVEAFKKVVKKETGKEFPQNPKDQLMMAVEAVFRSWNNPRARVYRDLNDISHTMGTAVNIQVMVFGNTGEDSGTGVAFTRNPSTGENKLYGEFLMNAQGEDVVAGIRTPRDIEELKEILPEAYEQFCEVAKSLEIHYRDMQDIEFTIDSGTLYMLQTRTGKRTANAAIQIVVDMVKEELITKEEAILRLNPNDLDQLLHPTFNEKALNDASFITNGLPASSGAASGKIYFSPEDAVKAKADGESVILVRNETSPEDIEGMVASVGILTAKGGMTSHAAVVARGMGKCCVSGAGELNINESEKVMSIDDQHFGEGDFISLDGNTGHVYAGQIETQDASLGGEFLTLMKWADSVRKLKVRTNADTPKDSAKAVEFGAEGIGLCRTEHMFFEDNRISVMRRMILSRSIEDRKKALDKLMPMQKEDFIGIFKAMGSRPVTIRLLDPPLHEFLPSEKADIEKLALEMEVPYSRLKETVFELKEVNPMLGHRGCRLAVTYPEIYEMQVRAIMEAAAELKQKENQEVIPEIMIPLVGEVKEFDYVKELAENVIEEVFEDYGITVPYLIGTMIEIPRATIIADEIAKGAEFFSFGTNDLTQMTYGFSRDDAGRFIKEYREKGILEKDPFQQIDRKGVGELMKMAIERGQQTRKDIKLGICGEHGGEPNSVEFCHIIGLDYVSCSPFRVPIARLAAAQAALRYS